MKKIITIIALSLTILLVATGCELFKRDKMENIEIITSIYPIEYVTERLYGESSNVKSIYPKGSDISKYKLTKKQIKDFSSNDLFVYNGTTNEREYATSMLNQNKNLKIIDAAYGIESTYSSHDVWLNPSNVLMIAQNIRNELFEYITNPYLVSEINEQYDLLKIDITELETEYKKTADNSINKSIISYDESLKFLEKYGFTVINLTEEGKSKDNNVIKAQELLKGKKLNYVFVTELNEDDGIIDDLLNNYGAKKLTFRVLETINEEDLVKNNDYLSIMHNNIEQIKIETYK
jgi:ABC-type metal ion transport system, periplasmic component/surface adhesin